jgi:hypothetical protein
MENYSQLNSNKIRKYQKNVENFLNQKRVGSGSDIKYTHVAMGETFVGKFYLNEEDNNEFNKIYAEAVQYGVVFSIAERPKEYGPLLIDVDLELPLESFENGSRLYNKKMIKEVIKAYRTTAKQYLKLDRNDLEASIFEKSKPTRKETVIKDGFHIIFHGIIAHYKLRYLIRDKVVKILKDLEIFDFYDVDKVIDKQVVHTNSWLLPGSRKKDGQIYELTRVYNENNEPINIDHILKDKNKMIELYSLQSEDNCKDYETDFIDGVSFDVIENEFSNLGSRPKKQIKIDKPINNDLFKYNTVLEYLISYDDYDPWTKCGMILKNELKNDDALSLYLEWSGQSKKFKMKECINHFNSFKKDGSLTFKSLIWMVKECNPEQYDEMMKKLNEHENHNKIKGVFNDLEAAQKVYELYKYWVCCDDILYVFDDKTGLWTKNETVMFSIISRFNEDLFLLSRNYKDEIQKSSKGYGNSTILQRQMIPQLKTLCINNSWLTNTNLSTMNKILFLNGYYEMNTGVFHEKFNPDLVFFVRIERKYETFNDNEYIESVKQRLFYNQLGEDVGNYLMLNILMNLITLN